MTEQLEFLQTHCKRLMDIAERCTDDRTKVELAMVVQQIIEKMQTGFDYPATDSLN
jgi:hypothetical protein